MTPRPSVLEIWSAIFAGCIFFWTVMLGLFFGAFQ